MPSRFRQPPAHGWLGLGLIAVCWPLSWGLEGLRTHVLFAPQWLGYVLVVDALTAARAGSSTLTRTPGFFWAQFAVSTPAWWLFELVNLRTGNWEYIGRERFTDLEYFLLASISFSTVLPAVLGSAQLFRTFRWVERFARGPALQPTRRVEIALAWTGAAMLGALLAWPRVFYPFAWTALVLLLEPLCLGLGRRSLLTDLARGDWRPWVSLWAGGLACGFFWELWNLHAYPKWIYHIPGVDFGRLFGMPILGYLGYLPFSMELFLLAQLALPRARELRL